jgi:D-alanyl-D-alanine carboxypeptidase
MRLRIAVTLAGVALITALAAGVVIVRGGSEQLRSSPLTARIARQLADADATSAIVYVADGNRRYEATAAAYGAKPPKPDQLFAVGSVTKTFTAAIVLELASEEKLRLDDSLERYLPGVVKGGEKITIRELLRHQSGLANYTDYADWTLKAALSPNLGPLDVLRFAAKKPRAFKPGTAWAYSNTNYIALGLIIERVSGHSYEHELRQRILEPLALRQTGLPTKEQIVDLTGMVANPRTAAWADGGIVSNAEDLARFYSALLGGRLLPPSALAEMRETIDTSSSMGFGTRDGLGIFSFPLDCGTGWGHQGLILDFNTLAIASKDGHRVAIISERGPSLLGPQLGSTLLCEKR